MHKARVIASPPRLTPRFRKGETIFEEGDRADCIYEVVSGWVRLQILTVDGVRQILAFLGPGEAFSFFPGPQTMTAEAVTDTFLSRISQSALADPEVSPGDHAALLEEIGRRYDELAHHIHQLTHVQVEQRLLCFLAWLTHRQGVEKSIGMVRIPMSRTDIGDYLSIAPATLSRAFAHLHQSGRIVMNGPRLFAIKGEARYGRFCRAAASICGGCPVTLDESLGRTPRLSAS